MTSIVSCIHVVSGAQSGVVSDEKETSGRLLSDLSIFNAQLYNNLSIFLLSDFAALRELL